MQANSMISFETSNERWFGPTTSAEAPTEHPSLPPSPVRPEQFYGRLSVFRHGDREPLLIGIRARGLPNRRDG